MDLTGCSSKAESFNVIEWAMKVRVLMMVE